MYKIQFKTIKTMYKKFQKLNYIQKIKHKTILTIKSILTYQLEISIYVRLRLRIKHCKHNIFQIKQKKNNF